MLECIMCGHIIIQNNRPKSYAVCTHCNAYDLTAKQKQTILRQKKKLLKIQKEEFSKELDRL